jgi:hypothetical protein
MSILLRTTGGKTSGRGIDRGRREAARAIEEVWSIRIGIGDDYGIAIEDESETGYEQHYTDDEKFLHDSFRKLMELGAALNPRVPIVRHYGTVSSLHATTYLLSGLPPHLFLRWQNDLQICEIPWSEPENRGIL